MSAHTPVHKSKENVMHPRKPYSPPRTWTVVLFLGIGLLIFTLSIFASPAQAAPPPQGEKPNNDFCLGCHQEQGQTLSLGGEELSVTINPIQFGLSVHSEEGIACVDCHSGISDYPHPEVQAKSAHEFSLALAETCEECHEDQYSKAHDSVHQAATDAGNENAPLCSDCHNPHTQTRLIGQESGLLTISARKEIPATCAECHAETYDQYKKSVHGSALNDGNADVPTCTDCHGVHNIDDPTTASFRNNTPALCSDCHDNPEIM